MRIIIASDQHWPMVSGVATAGRTLAHGLAAAGHDVLVIAPSQTGKKYDEIDENYRITRTRSVPFPARQNIRVSVALQNEIKHIIKDFNPAIVHVQTQGPVGLVALRMARKLDIPAVATNHVMPENLIENVKILMPLARPISYIIKEYGILLYRGAEHIIMPTQAAIDMFNYGGFNENVPISPVSNGIDLSRFKPGKVPAELRKRFDLPANKPIITCICRLDGEKHVHVLIKAFQRVLEEVDAHLLLVGQGNASEDLKALVHELGLEDKVTFTGRVSDKDLYVLHRCGTVFAMPSPAELQCLAMLEAMASGQPAVAVKAGALHELCQDGRNGYLCEVDDDEDMAAKLLTILRDKKLRAKMSKESLAIAQVHDVKSVIVQFEKIYKDVIKNHIATSEKTKEPAIS